MLIRLSSNLTSDSIVDGVGLRTVIWTQGCKHNCKGCHNRETHDFKGGFLVDIENIKKDLRDLKIQRGITFSGGDPFEQPLVCADLARYAKSLGLDIWAYTGYLYEDLLLDKEKLEFLKEVDILVDGPFILEERDLTLRYRGSRNQRIIDVGKSLKSNSVVIKNGYYNDLNIKDLFENVI